MFGSPSVAELPAGHCGCDRQTQTHLRRRTREMRASTMSVTDAAVSCCTFERRRTVRARQRVQPCRGEGLSVALHDGQRSAGTAACYADDAPSEGRCEKLEGWRVSALHTTRKEIEAKEDEVSVSVSQDTQPQYRPQYFQRRGTALSRAKRPQKFVACAICALAARTLTLPAQAVKKTDQLGDLVFVCFISPTVYRT